MNEQEGSTLQGGLGGAGQGAAAGAAVGTAVAPGIGTAVGAAVGAVIGGAIGGIGGFMSGGKKKKAAKYMKKAIAIQQQREAEAYKQNLLSQIRNARIARASAMAATVAAGTEEGTGAQGALSSYGSQTANIVEYLSVDRGRAVKAAKYMSRAKKNLSTAAAIDSTTNGIINLGTSVANAYASYKSAQPQQPATTQNNYGPDNSQYVYTWTNNPNIMLQVPNK